MSKRSVSWIAAGESQIGVARPVGQHVAAQELRPAHLAFRFNTKGELKVIHKPPKSLMAIARELRAAAELATGNPAMVSIEAKKLLEYADDIHANDLIDDAALGHKPRDDEDGRSPGLLRRLFQRS